MPETALPSAKQCAFDYVERNADAIAQLGDNIYYYGELGMQEYRSAGLMADTLEQHGFQVARGISGMPTAFLATYGSGKPVIAVLLSTTPTRTTRSCPAWRTIGLSSTGRQAIARVTT